MTECKANSNNRYIFVDGAGGSGADHWFAQWISQLPNAHRVEQSNWNGGTREEWVQNLDTCIKSANSSAILIAHSLGCVVASHWLSSHTDMIKAALLVAPADVEGDWAEPNSLYTKFQPIPINPLPCTSFLVASSNDPYLTLPRAEILADNWGSQLRLVGNAGHIGSDSMLGNWSVGRKILDELESLVI